MANELKTRIQLRHDTEENWTSVKDSFIPLVGEACLTTDGENKGKVKLVMEQALGVSQNILVEKILQKLIHLL